MRALAAAAVLVALSCVVEASDPAPAPRKPAAKEGERPPAKEAATTRPALKGRSGSVEWEVVDVVQTRLAEEEAIRWDFVVSLRATGEGEIRLTRFEAGTGTTVTNQRTINAPLRPGEGVRMVHWERTSRGENRREIFRRYVGRDDKGNAETIEVLIPLEPSLGARPQAAATARVAAPPGDALLPPDLRVIRPGGGVPAEWAAFSGVWSGQFDGGRAHVLVVEEVGARDATVAYGIGPFRDRPGTWWRLKARPRRDQLVVHMAYNETAAYTRAEDGVLVVTWTSEDGRSARGRLTRYTGGPPRPDDSPLARAGQLASEALAALHDGQYADALPKAQEALAIREARLGGAHPDVAASLTTLAEIHRAQGRLDDAERLHRRALSIREAQLGREHPEVAASLNHLAVLQNARGKYKDAEGLLTRALAILDKSPANAPRANRVKVDVLETLSKVYRAQGRTREAEETQARATMLWATQ
jgi:hypothetical protein